MSFSGAVLILVVALIRVVAVNRMPKKTFLVLWWIVLLRLLLPFSVPSPWSVYSIIQRNIPAEIVDEMWLGNFSLAEREGQPKDAERAEISESSAGENAVSEFSAGKEAISGPSAGEAEVFNSSAGRAAVSGLFAGSVFSGSPVRPGSMGHPVSVWHILWFAGMVCCGVFFTTSYIRRLLEFRISLPVQNDFVKQWLKENPLMRPLSVRQSDWVSAPLTYGVLRPVILMPKSTDWENKKQLLFIFVHEYVHIRRLDAVAKLIMVLTLCVHWFNPFVWMMYVLFNRDMELACDESVVRKAGESERAVYARMLISMEEERSGLMPLGSGFCKNAVEERITAIMKIRKTSVPAVLTAAVLTVCVTTVFATSAAGGGEEKRSMPDKSFSEEDYEKLFALQFEGYEDMSVAEYQDRVWEMTDTAEYRELLERFSGDDNDLYNLKDSDETASFFFYTLEPLTAERWQSRSFGGYAATDRPGAYDNAVLEFFYTLTVQDADALTVGEYNEARLGVTEGLQGILQGKTDGQLQDDALMQGEIEAEIEALTERWNSDKLQVSVEYFYEPLSEINGESGRYRDGEGAILEEQETRDFPPADGEDYRSLMTLKTPGYQNRPLADFNMDLLNWANEDYERMERISGDAGYNDFAVELSEEERAFVTQSVWFSGTENGEYVRSNYTGRAEEDPVYNRYLPSKTVEENGAAAWCDLFYQFSYHIADREAITVGERDRCVMDLLNSVQQFWDETDMEQMLHMTQEDIADRLKEIAAGCSDDKIRITIKENSVHFEKMDERDLERR